MAVDGATSPVHQASTEAKMIKTVGSEVTSDDSRHTLNANEEATPGDVADVDIKPAVSPMTSGDERQSLDGGMLSKSESSALPADNSGYYFGESHVTRLESFVESLTGPLRQSHQSAAYGNRWSAVREWSNGLAAAAQTGSPINRKPPPPQQSSTVDSATANNQPLDLSVKPRGHSAKTFIGSPSSSSFSPPESRLRAGGDDMSSLNAAFAAAAAAASASAGTGFPSAGYPSLTDMWIAQWLSVASAASGLLTHLPLHLQAHRPLLSAAALPPGLQQSDHREMSPRVLPSRIESPKSSSSLSCPTPTNSGGAGSPGCLQDGAVHTSSSLPMADHRRSRGGKSSVTSSPQQPASAFSLFQRGHLGRRADASSDVAFDNGIVKSDVAALSAIESFVENSFSHNKNVRSSYLGSRDTGHHDEPNAATRGIKRGRHVTDDRMTSSGDEDTGSRDSAERTTGNGGKRRRHQYHHDHRLRPEAEHQRRVVEERRRDRCDSGDAQSVIQSDGANGSLEYLQCLAYDRPIDSEHPLECLQRLVHVQSTPRRTAHQHHQQAVVTSRDNFPTTTSIRSSNSRDDATTPPRVSDRVEPSSISENHVTCSSGDEQTEMASKDDEVAISSSVQQLAETFRSSTAASLVCCNM